MESQEYYALVLHNARLNIIRGDALVRNLRERVKIRDEEIEYYKEFERFDMLNDQVTDESYMLQSHLDLFFQQNRRIAHKKIKKLRNSAKEQSKQIIKEIEISALRLRNAEISKINNEIKNKEEQSASPLDGAFYISKLEKINSSINSMKEKKTEWEKSINDLEMLEKTSHKKIARLPSPTLTLKKIMQNI